MPRKLRLAILFGGKSAEHEVSLQSARNIAEAIDKNKYEVVPIAIDKKGRWCLDKTSESLLYSDISKSIALNEVTNDLAVIPEKGFDQLSNASQCQPLAPVDVVFPVLHGPFGEDGSVQGLLKLAGVPFVGASVLGSAVGMDKDVMRRLLRDAGLPIPKFIVFDKWSRERICFNHVKNQLAMPLFVKPANLGSSVGISKVANETQFQEAVALAFEYDNKIIIDEYIEGREIECSVLGNDSPIASLPGEIIPQDEFYSYKGKYIDENGAILDIPAKLTDELTKKVQECAIEAFKVLCCRGMARVDFLLKGDNVVVSEINTIPGFTKISMYQKLWEVSGISYPELIDRLIELALESFAEEQKLRSDIP